jgi:gluconolactonase
MPELQDVDVITEGLRFPEGPVACTDGSVLVVEMMGGCVSRVAPDGTTAVVADVGGGPNGLAVGPDGALYVCNNGGVGRSDRARVGGSIQRVDPASGVVETLYTECDGTPLIVPNDLVFDPSGGFYFTDNAPRGALYYARPDGSAIDRVVADVPAPNGVGISPEGDTLYWAQTHTRQIHRRRITGPGRIESSPGYGIAALFFEGAVDPYTLVAGLPGNHELDSLAIDSSGAICVGTLVDAGISEITPDGAWQLHTLPSELADPMTTNICFGGDDLTTAFVTCSMTGRLVRCRWPRPGLRLAFAI